MLSEMQKQFAEMKDQHDNDPRRVKAINALLRIIKEDDNPRNVIDACKIILEII